ncbi:hypothetical protein FRC09_006278 [Ceratobasidium sp. 395]|nr:hypothetical protein FRC09_006278 [Ceratobasidium sp. 395]
MPATDPADQSAAREIESSLRAAIESRERPPIELTWFLALPKRVRRSGKLLETAQAESRVLLEHIQVDWARTRQADREREEQLARAKTLPRNLDCLRAPDPKAWNGLGRRKKRCRTFKAVGRAFVSRQRVPEPVQLPRPNQSLDPVHSAPTTRHRTSCAVQTDANPVPTRPPTPDGLRDAVQKSSLLVATASGPATYGLTTPEDCTPSPAPTPSTPPMQISVPAYPHNLRPGELTVFGKEVDRDVAYIAARGRHAWAPLLDRPLRDLAVDIVCAEQLAPGALGYLVNLLFPAGASQYDQALDGSGMEILVDFIRGWYEIVTEGF